jgi:hypothetical protein
MTAGILTMIAAIILLLAIMTWQPWQDGRVHSGGGIQGGGDATPTPVRQAPSPP